MEEDTVCVVVMVFEIIRRIWWIWRFLQVKAISQMSGKEILLW